MNVQNYIDQLCDIAIANKLPQNIMLVLPPDDIQAINDYLKDLGGLRFLTAGEGCDKLEYGGFSFNIISTSKLRE